MCFVKPIVRLQALPGCWMPRLGRLCVIFEAFVGTIVVASTLGHVPSILKLASSTAGVAEPDLRPPLWLAAAASAVYFGGAMHWLVSTACSLQGQRLLGQRPLLARLDALFYHDSHVALAVSKQQHLPRPTKAVGRAAECFFTSWFALGK